MVASTFLFDRGARALTLALPRLPHARLSEPVTDGDVFVCPLCLAGFDRDRIRALTREHVPPKSLSGVVVTLTCAACNSGAGRLQSHAANEARWRRFASAASDATHTVRVSGPGGGRVTAELQLCADGYFLIVDPDRSSPNDLYRLVKAFTDRSGGEHPPSFSMTISTDFIPAHVRTSRLRDAYLAAFALLGYRYILWPDLDDVRRQIAESDPDPTLSWRTDPFPLGFRGILIVQRPVPCAVIIMDGDAVFLPWPAAGDQLAGWLATSGAQSIGGLKARPYPWPSGMPMLLDFAAVPRLGER